MNLGSLPIDVCYQLSLYSLELFLALARRREFFDDLIQHPLALSRIIRAHTVRTRIWCEEFSCFYMRYTFNGRMHREDDLPSLEYSNGSRAWTRYGKLHSDEDHPALIVLHYIAYQMQGYPVMYLWSPSSSLNIWYKNGNIHRDGDRPAVVRNRRHLEWWQHGRRHRIGEPAIIYEFIETGDDEWWHKGKKEGRKRRWLRSKINSLKRIIKS